MFPAVLDPLGHEGSDELFHLHDLGVSLHDKELLNGPDTVKTGQRHSNQALMQPQP